VGQLRLVQHLLVSDQYDGMNLVGRFLSVLFDTGSIVLCFLLGRLLYGAAAGAIAAACYAFAALAVQQAHYYVVDPVMTFFILLTLFFAVRALRGGRPRDGVLCGVCFGLAVATKVSAAPLGLAVLLAQLLPMLAARRQPGRAQRHLIYTSRLEGLLLAGVGAIAAFVLTEPYALLDWKQFSHDISEQSGMVRGALDYPYTRQYAPTTPYLYWLQGLFSWQLAPALTVAGLAGLAWQGWQALRPRRDAERLLVAWWLPYLLLTGAFYAKFPRYMLPAVPFMAIAAGGLFALGIAAARLPAPK
jgi:4-amino-4-deoxy-L-arabinose transferase-like glycosyltransferase